MATLDLTACGVRLEPAGRRHARELGRIMRTKDWEELKATGFHAQEAAVRMSINHSAEAYAAYLDDKLMCVFGAGPMGAAPEITVVWSLTSVHVDKHPLTFWKCSKAAVSYLRDKYPLMVNMIHGQYTEALRWLERLGFQIGPPEQYGRRGDLFCRALLVTQKVVLEAPHV